MKLKLPLLTLICGSLVLAACNTQPTTSSLPSPTITPTPIPTSVITPAKSTNLNDLNKELNLSVDGDGGKADIQQLQKDSVGL